MIWLMDGSEDFNHLTTTSTGLSTRIKTVIDMEQRSASMAPITPLYVSRMLNVPIEEVEEAMKEMGLPLAISK